MGVWALLAPSSGWAQGEVDADPAQACVDDHTAGQLSRRDGELLKARDEFARCATDRCPALVVQDCVALLEAVERELPSLIVAVRQADGRDVPDARVAIDGAPRPELRVGQAFVLDPGPHAIRIDEGERHARLDVVVALGEKNRRVIIELSAPPEPPPLPMPDRAAGNEVMVAGYVLAGLGGATLTVAAGLGLSGLLELDGIDDRCGKRANPPNTCSEDDLAGLRRKFLAADVSAGVGAGLFAVGASLLLYHYVNVPDDEPGVSLAPIITPSLAGLWASLRF
ncbi:MAG: hypothetical protein R3B72_18010 [Polyangiaceae bacterium]